MKLTNRYNLPQPIADAVKNDTYSRGESENSVTGLLRPPRAAALEEKHWEDLSEDVSDRIWSLVGQVMHGILERADSSGIAERRLSFEIEGWRISGQMDRYCDGVLSDYKFVTAYKFKDGKVPEEFEQQLNCYAEILRQNGHPVRRLELVAILRDWSKLEARRDQNFPQKQVMVLEVPLWPAYVASKFMRERVILHKQARLVLPQCSDAERWAKPDIWAVMKKGRDRAVKLYGSQTEAKAHASTDATLSVVHRPGQNVRCENYCSVSEFCLQYQGLIPVIKEEEIA